jgi:hypothetical protein
MPALRAVIGSDAARRRAHVALAGAVVAVFAACGGSTPAASDDSSAPDPTTAPATTSTTVPQRCDWEFNTVAFWEQNPPEVSEGHQHGHGGGQGNEHGVQAWKPMTDAGACEELGAHIDTMESVAARYPTAQDALDAGCFRATIYVPGIAAHYYCVAHHTAGTDIEHPTMLLYGGSQPTAPIVGLSYMVYEDTAPDDQADSPLWATYMPWHFHEGLCIKGGMVIGGDNSDEERCESAGGTKAGRTGWMGHYWLSNCPSPDGVFSAANPRLDLGVAVYNDDAANRDDRAALLAAPCRGSDLEIDEDGADAFGPPEHGGMDHEGMDHGEH